MGQTCEFYVTHVNYGIAHKSDPGCIFFLNPGTAMNHSREATVEYKMDLAGEMELWTCWPVTAGEEMFNDYALDFGACGWCDEPYLEEQETFSSGSFIHCPQSHDVVCPSVET